MKIETDSAVEMTQEIIGWEMLLQDFIIIKILGSHIFFIIIETQMSWFPGLKPWKCSQCHKSYTNAKSLQMHEDSHQGKTYACQVSYNNHQKVQIHVKILLVNRPGFIERLHC